MRRVKPPLPLRIPHHSISESRLVLTTIPIKYGCQAEKSVVKISDHKSLRDKIKQYYFTQSLRRDNIKK